MEAKVPRGCIFLTMPPVITKTLSVDTVPFCTPVKYKGFAAAKTCSLYDGFERPIPTFPAEVTLSLSVLFVFVTTSTASVVPRKFVPATVPLLPVSCQKLPLPLLHDGAAAPFDIRN